MVEPSLNSRDQALAQYLLQSGKFSRSELQDLLHRYNAQPEPQHPALADFLIAEQRLEPEEAAGAAGHEIPHEAVGAGQARPNRRQGRSPSEKRAAARAAAGFAPEPRPSEAFVFGKPPPIVSDDPVLGEIHRRAARRAQRQAEEKEIPHRLGGYELLSRIDRGGSGTVFKARQIKMHRIVALKVLSRSLSEENEQLQRFWREAQSAGVLNHPNIVQVHEIGQDQGLHFFSMEYVDGINVQRLLGREGRLPPLRALRIVMEVAKGLFHAERHGIIHRDVKPDNILVTRSDAEVKLADLGLAKRLQPIIDTHTAENVAMGTPYYMAVEQGRSAAHVDHRADIYALGATFYHMITGQVPFDGKTSLEILLRAAEEPLVPPSIVEPEIPPAMNAVIEKMMAKDPDARYQSFGDVITDLALLHEHCESGGRLALYTTLDGRLTRVRDNPLSLPAGLHDPAAAETHRRRLWVRRGLIAATLLMAFVALGLALPEGNAPQRPRPKLVLPPTAPPPPPPAEQEEAQDAPQVAEAPEQPAAEAAEREAQRRNIEELLRRHSHDSDTYLKVITRVRQMLHETSDPEWREVLSAQLQRLEQRHRAAGRARLQQAVRAADLLADDGYFADAQHVLLAFPADDYGQQLMDEVDRARQALVVRAQQAVRAGAAQIQQLSSRGAYGRAKQLAETTLARLQPTRTTRTLQKAIDDAAPAHAVRPEEEALPDEALPRLQALFARLRSFTDQPPPVPADATLAACRALQPMRRAVERAGAVAGQFAETQTRVRQEAQDVQAADQARVAQVAALAGRWEFEHALGLAQDIFGIIRDAGQAKELEWRIQRLRVLSRYKIRLIQRLNDLHPPLRVSELRKRYKSDKIIGADRQGIVLELTTGITTRARWSELTDDERLAIAADLLISRHGRDHLGLGALYFELGRLPAAERHLQAAVEHDEPQAQKLMAALAEVHRNYAERQAAAALSAARRALQQHEPQQALDALARLAAEYGDCPNAEYRQDEASWLAREAEQLLVRGGPFAGHLTAWPEAPSMTLTYQWRDADAELRDWRVAGTAAVQPVGAALQPPPRQRPVLYYRPILRGCATVEIRFGLKDLQEGGIGLELVPQGDEDDVLPTFGVSLAEDLAAGTPLLPDWVGRGLYVGSQTVRSQSAFELKADTGHVLRLQCRANEVGWWLDGKMIGHAVLPAFAADHALRIRLTDGVRLGAVQVRARIQPQWLEQVQEARRSEASEALRAAADLRDPVARLDALQKVARRYVDLRSIAFEAQLGAARAELELQRQPAAVLRLRRILACYPTVQGASREAACELLEDPASL